MRKIGFLLIVLGVVFLLTAYRVWTSKARLLTGQVSQNSCNELDEEGIASKQGPLTNNAGRGRADCVRYLLKTGANPNEGKENGYTPLLAAAQYGHIDEARLLIQAGADVNFDSRGTPLCRALQNQRARLELVSLLVDSGAKLTWGPASSALNCLADINGRREKFEYLLSRGIVQQLTQRQKDAALADLEWSEARYLILQGASPNAVDSSGETILVRATKNYQCEIVQFLVGHGADPSLKDSNGHTALDWAEDAEASLNVLIQRSTALPQARQSSAMNKAIIQILRQPKSAGSVSCQVAK